MHRREAYHFRCSVIICSERVERVNFAAAQNGSALSTRSFRVHNGGKFCYNISF